MTQINPHLNKNQKGFANIIVIIGIVILAGAAGYFIVSQQTPSPASIPSPTPSSAPALIPTSTLTPQPTPAPTSTPVPAPTPKNANDFYEVTYQDVDLRCLGMGGSREFVVRTQPEYQHLIDTSPDLHPNPFLLCLDYKFPVIDFTQKTLLGKSITGSGCSSEIKKKVLRNDNNRQVIYSVTTTFIGGCEMAISHTNWILIPKINEDYRVNIELNSGSEQ